MHFSRLHALFELQRAASGAAANRLKVRCCVRLPYESAPERRKR